MKKVVRSMGNMLIALSVAVSMFSNVCIGAQAAEDESGALYENEANSESGANDENGQAGQGGFSEKLTKLLDSIDWSNRVDTVVIDFSQNKIQRYDGKPLYTNDLDNITDLDLTDEAKNVVYINSLHNYNHLFKEELDFYDGAATAEGRLIIDEAAGQYIKFKASTEGTVFDASESSGTYETVIKYKDLLETSGSATGSAEDDAQMALFGACVFYGVNSFFFNDNYNPDAMNEFNPEFNLIINFGDAQKAEDDSTEDNKNEEPSLETPTEDPAPVEEEKKDEPKTEEDAPAVEEEKKDEPKTEEETPVVEEEEKPSEETPAVEEEKKEVNNTVVIDFSKNKTQCLNQPITSGDFNEIAQLAKTDEEKNVVFMSAMLFYYNLFTAEYDSTDSMSTGVGRLVLDRNANQIINIKSDENGTTYYAGAASGTYEIVITESLLKNNVAGNDPEGAFMAAKGYYGVDTIEDENGERSFKLQIVFGEPDPKALEEKKDEPKTEEETPAVEEEKKEEPAKEEKPSEEKTSDVPTPVKEEPLNKEENKAAENKAEEKTSATATEPAKEKKNETVETPAVDTEFEDNGYSYKVTSADEVAFVGITDKTAKSVTIPDTVVYQNNTFKVTAVADKALCGCKKLTSVTVGENITSIGAFAFARCKKLKNVTIKSASVKTIGKKAFFKNSKKLVVKVPKTSYKSYKKMLKKVKISVKLKKIK
ncbi:leucine-rich repeat domain-containing protein [Butyrivibrio sp. WCD2001]|uniref:leucine-rich repeat domain-containing protein n=1 Tax=Butyrivibrio sp. WCD2001 TaxID=1280681 RepID=UPI0003F59981|nr:leucine-rich repeat domain-containing protein [Butyrivibrio sp. WCD2001]